MEKNTKDMTNLKDIKDMRKIKKAKRRRKKKIRILIAVILAVVVLLTIGIVVFVNWMLGKINHKDIDKSPEALGISSEYQDNGQYGDIVNVALFGVDSRGDEPGRSDAIMILSVNRKKNEVKVISIMRDSYVKIEGHGYTKLNEAYYYGGAPLAIKTLNQDYDLNIKDYVTVNFDSLAKVIDAVGGVTINVTEAERGNANHNIQEYAGIWDVTPTYIDHSGEQVLNGMQAVGYARIRYIGNADYQRTERQRTVMQQLFNKALKMSPLDYPKMLSTVLPLVETSMKSEDILGIGTSVMKSGSAQFQQARFPVDKDILTDGTINGKIIDNGTIDDVSYVISDLDVTSTKLHDYIFDDVDPSQNTYTSPSANQPQSTTKKSTTKQTTARQSTTRQTTTKQTTTKARTTTGRTTTAAYSTSGQD